VTTIATVCGSLGERSANSAALDVAERHLVGPHPTGGRVEIERFDELADIPAFRPELVDDPPAVVDRLRAHLECADGVLIAAPEYAGGLAGATKNALDWLVGSASLDRMPVAVLSAGTTGGAFAIEQLVRTLSWQGARTVATLSIGAPRTKSDEHGAIVDPSTIESIAEWADDLLTSLAEPADVQLSRVAEVVGRYGIDVARFGR
jgi:chromate reductase, NAD(P)H dehydrogenase (quinone)